jgi:hypothetical protein
VTDPIGEAFRSYTPRPKDTVRKTPPAQDDQPIPTGLAVEYYSDEIGDDGVTRETGTAFVRMYRPKAMENERR